MQKLLLFVFLLFSSSLFAQRGFLYVKKNGYKKVRTFQEGSVLKFRTRDDQIVFGTMALVKKDSILVNNNCFTPSNIKTLYLREDHYQFDSHTFWLTTAAPRNGGYDSGRMDQLRKSTRLFCSARPTATF